MLSSTSSDAQLVISQSTSARPFFTLSSVVESSRSKTMKWIDLSCAAPGLNADELQVRWLLMLRNVTDEVLRSVPSPVAGETLIPDFDDCMQ